METHLKFSNIASTTQGRSCWASYRSYCIYNTAPKFSDAVLIYQARRESLEEVAAGTREMDVPEWTLRLVRSRQNEEFSGVFIT